MRLYAAADDFWLDEIFNYFLTRDQVHSWTDVFFGITMEHHILVSLGMYLMGDQKDWLWYRLPSVITGTASLALLALAGYRRMGLGTLAATVAMAAVSYPLVVYSSEARGYAPASFFTLAMFVFLEAFRRTGRWWYLASFWVASAIAVLYHPAALCVLLALGMYSLVRGWRLRAPLSGVARELALCYAVPLAFSVWVYVAIMRHWKSTGGTLLPLRRVLADTMATAVGLPMRSEFQYPALLLGVGLIAASLWILLRRGRVDIAAFYLSALVAAPALMLVVSDRSYIYVRYFAVLFPFFFLMIGEALDAASRTSWRARAVVVVLYVLMLLGNAVATVSFLRDGRGAYAKAVRTMAANTPRPSITVGGDHDFRNGVTLEFYKRYLPKDRRMTYFTKNGWPPGGPDWFLVSNPCDAQDYKPMDAITISAWTFRLVASYPVFGLSGLGWHVYRNDANF